MAQVKFKLSCLEDSYVGIIIKAICIFCLMITSVNGIAQGLESQSNTTGYIDCSHGVTIITQKVRKIKKTSTYEFYYSFGNETLTAQSLYALDVNGEPETLLWVRIPRHFWSNNPDWDTYYCEYSILPGTKRIAKGAFKNCGNIVQLHIPSSIKYIPENGFDGLNQYALIDIKDDAPASIISQQVPATEIEEVGRYNLQGMRVDEDVHGVQIVQYSDGSARKVLGK